MKNIILATDNMGKIAELKKILAPVHCIRQAAFGIESPEETGHSFVENALIKARYASRIAQQPALADDSGLVVRALQGAPGIRSARYAGDQASDQDNINLLLENLQEVPETQRQAFFYCTIAMVQHAEDPVPLIAFGHLPGTIALTPAGDQGFGYDPVFFLPDYQCTLAQLPPGLKNKISHRAIALHSLQQQLHVLLPT